MRMPFHEPVENMTNPIVLCFQYLFSGTNCIQILSSTTLEMQALGQLLMPGGADTHCAAAADGANLCRHVVFLPVVH
jgi:hypothetical protein